MSRYFKFNKSNPQPRAICDRCGFQWERRALSEQVEFRGGEAPVGIGILVCPTCYDEPQPFFARPRVKQDPTPVYMPRPEPPEIDIAYWVLSNGVWNDGLPWLDYEQWDDGT